MRTAADGHQYVWDGRNHYPRIHQIEVMCGPYGERRGHGFGHYNEYGMSQEYGCDLFLSGIRRDIAGHLGKFDQETCKD